MLLAFSLPFDRFPTFSVLSIDIKISSILGILCICLAVRKLYIEKKRISRLVYLVPLIIWSLWLVIRMIGVQNYLFGIRALLPMLFLTTLCGAVAILWEQRYTKPVLKTLLTGVIATLVFGVFQFIGNFAGVSNAITLIRPEYSWQGFGFPRVHSFSVEPLYFASYLLLPVAIVGSLILKKKYSNWKLYILLLACCSTIVLTLSRGGILGLLVLFLALGVLYFKEIRTVLSLKLVLGFLIGLLISLGLVAGAIAVFSRQGNDSDLTYGKRGIATFVSHLANTRFSANQANKDKEDSIGQRDSARAQAVEILKEDRKVLLIGQGPGQSDIYAVNKYGITRAGDANNMILEQLLQSGVVGLCILGIFFVNLLVGLYKLRQTEYDWLSTGLFVYLLALLVQAQTFHGLLLTHFWFSLGVAAAFLSLNSNRPDSSKKTS